MRSGLLVSGSPLPLVFHLEMNDFQHICSIKVHRIWSSMEEILDETDDIPMYDVRQKNIHVMVTMGTVTNR